MTKADLIEAIAKEADLSKADAGKALNATLDTITNAMRKDEKVSLVGFGTFSLAKRPKRKGRNPQTGASITIPARKVPRFTAGKALKDRVQRKR
ncbi:MAG TPA: HU family DNA-binding protein [bacterium]|jgi:DNA-binding protein HU-beta